MNGVSIIYEFPSIKPPFQISENPPCRIHLPIWEYLFNKPKSTPIVNYFSFKSLFSTGKCLQRSDPETAATLANSRALNATKQSQSAPSVSNLTATVIIALS